MSPKQVIEYIGTQAAAAEALGIRQPSVAEWVANDAIPIGRQCQIELLTRGRLRASIGRRMLWREEAEG